MGSSRSWTYEGGCNHRQVPSFFPIERVVVIGKYKW